MRNSSVCGSLVAVVESEGSLPRLVRCCSVFSDLSRVLGRGLAGAPRMKDGGAASQLMYSFSVAIGPSLTSVVARFREFGEGGMPNWLILAKIITL